MHLVLSLSLWNGFRKQVQSFRVQKQTKFADFKLQVEQELGIPVANQRYWLWAKRQNHTYRPSRPLENAEDGLTLMQIKDQASPQVHMELIFAWSDMLYSICTSRI